MSPRLAATRIRKSAICSFRLPISRSRIYDGSLVLGNSAASLSWLIFEGGGNLPTVSNPFGYLYAKTSTSHDSTSNSAYRFASGKGANRDSTLGFDVTYYAPKHPDSSTFIVASFSLYKGTKNPTGSVTGLTVAYAADMDVKDDSSDNVGGFDATRQTIYQRGRYAPNDLRFAGIRGVRKTNTAITGGFAWENDVTVYPLGGYENDTLWNKLQAVADYCRNRLLGRSELGSDDCTQFDNQRCEQ